MEIELLEVAREIQDKCENLVQEGIRGNVEKAVIIMREIDILVKDFENKITNSD